MNKNKKYLTLLLYIFLAAGVTSAPVNSVTVKPVNTQYSNNLLGIKLQKSKYGNINVNVITTKPYKIKLLPIQRGINEYLIFLPETFHSITSRPDFSRFKNIKDIEVKLVPNLDTNSNTGYTKISIKTTSSDQLVNVINTVAEPTNTIDLDLERLLASQKKVVKPDKKISIKSRPTSRKIKKQAKKYIKPTIKRKTPITSKPKTLKKITKNDLPPQKSVKAVNKPVKTSKVYNKKLSKRKLTTVSNKEPLVRLAKIDENKLKTKKDKKKFSVDNLVKVNHINIDFASIQNKVSKYLNFKKISEHFKMKYLFLIIAILALFEVIKYIIRQLKIDADKEFDKTKQANKIINKSKNIYNNQNNQQLTSNKKQSKSTNINNDIQIDDFIDTVSNKKSGYFTSPITSTQSEAQDKEFKILNKFNKETPEISFKSVSEKLFADSFNQLGLNNPSARRPSRSAMTMQNNRIRPTLSIPKPKRIINPLDKLIVLDGIKITEQRGLYVVKLEDKKALVGTINDQVFILKTFKQSNNPFISIKKTAGKPLNQDVFYIQVGDWKGVVTSNAQKFDLEMSF